jgi:hypothetical protein
MQSSRKWEEPPMHRSIGALAAASRRLVLTVVWLAVACTQNGTIVAPDEDLASDRRPPPVWIRMDIDPEVTFTQPLVVRRGYLTVRRFQGADAVFEGRGFRIEARGIQLGVADPCFPCELPGEVRIGSYFAGSFLGDGPAVVGGQQFDRLAYGGEIQLVGDPVLLSEGRAHGMLVAPFTLTAFLQGFLGDAFIPSPPEPSIHVRLTGQGSVKIRFELMGDRGSRLAIWETAEYTFRPGRAVGDIAERYLTGQPGAEGRGRVTR